MPNFAPDNAADARAALQDVVRDYGASGLDNPKVLAQVLPDLLPNAPLASNLLNAASSVGVARLLNDRLAASIPADAAVRDVAALLSQRQAIDTAAAQWVVAEYAFVLGHPVDPSLLAQVSPESPWQPTQYLAQPVSGQPVSGQPVSGQPGFGQPVSGQPVSGQPGFGQPVSGQPAFGQPISGQPMSGQPVSGQPVSGQPGFGQPVSGQPGFGQPVSGQPAFGQPVSGQPVSGQPVSGQPMPPQFAPGAAAGGIPPGGGLGAGAAPATQIDAPGQDRIAGRAQAPVQPNQGRILDDTAQFPPSQPPGYPAQPGFPQPPFPPQPGYPQQPGYPGGGYGYVPPRQRRTGLIVTLVIVALLLVGGGVTAIVLLGGKKNTPTGLSTQPPAVHTTPPPTTPPPTTPPPSQPPSNPPNNGGTTTLDQVMPTDLDLTQCQPDTQGLMDNTTEAIDCPEGENSTLPDATVYGFQFGNQSDYTAGLTQLNTTVNFDPDTAGSSCPPAGSEGDGATGWHRNSAPDTQLGKLECYTDTTKHNYYIWTDDDELTIIVVKSTTSQTFDQVNTWWSKNNNNGQ